MNPHDIENSLDNSGKNITFSTLTNSGTIAGLNLFSATADPGTLIFTPVVYYPITIETKENIDGNKPEFEPNEIWLKLAQSSFEFWDNESDSRYDRL
jgi:hypothetical protein